ncbi:MAG: hypothetical protein II325_00360, partial [Clostridia bacterium]|nr:hypothetical protein [Clostridia bacterium]
LDAITEVKCTELEELVLTHYHEGSSRLLSTVAASVKTRALRLPIPNGEEEIALAAGLTEEANWLTDLPEEVKAILPFEGGYDYILLYNWHTEEYNCLPAEPAEVGWYSFTCFLYDSETGIVTLWEFYWGNAS